MCTRARVHSVHTKQQQHTEKTNGGLLLFLALSLSSMHRVLLHKILNPCPLEVLEINGGTVNAIAGTQLTVRSRNHPFMIHATCYF